MWETIRGLGLIRSREGFLELANIKRFGYVVLIQIQVGWALLGL
jgi:hypothetical protein